MASSDSRKLERTKYPGIYKRGRTALRRPLEGPRQVTQAPVPHLRARARVQRQARRRAAADAPTGSAWRTYYDRWIDSYRGRTSRGLEDTTRELYRRTAQHHLLPYLIARERCAT